MEWQHLQNRTGNNMSVWQFTGQGSQHFNMGRSLESNSVFIEHWNLCQQEAMNLNIDLNTLAVDANLLNETQYSQPLIFAYEYALAMSMLDSHSSPNCLIGHSIGEYAAYVISEMIDLKTAIQLIILRGRLIGSLPKNTSGMLAVIGPQEKTLSVLNQLNNVDLAAINHEQQIVLSGALSDLDHAKKELKAKGMKAIMLNVSHGFHSHCMDHILDEFHHHASQILNKTAPSEIPIISTTTCQPIKELTADYLRDHIRQPVQYWPVIKKLMNNHDTFIEIGPKPILTKLLQNDAVTAQWAAQASIHADLK